MSVTTTKRKRAAKREETASTLGGLNLLGVVTSWEVGGTDVTHTQIVSALKSCGLPEDAEKELAWPTAFTRATYKLRKTYKDVREVKDYGDEIIYQVSSIEEEEDSSSEADKKLQLEAKGFLRLCKKSGALTSKKYKALATEFKEELDRCREARGGGDVTQVVQRLIEGSGADLFPIRPQGGAYFIFQKHADFIAKLKQFLKALGGSLVCFPVPEGTNLGDESVGEVVEAELERMVEALDRAVDDFDTNTRNSTMEEAANRIVQNRVKAQAYASVLSDKAAYVLSKIDASNAKLKAKIESIGEQRKEMAKSDKTVNGKDCFGARENTDCWKINRELGEEARTAEDIHKAVGAKYLSNTRRYLEKLCRQFPNLVEQFGDGFRRKE